MKANLSTTIPFNGFYSSLWSQELDSIEEREAEYMEERESEEGVAKELRLTASEFGEMFYWCANYSKIHEESARTIADAWNDLASEELNFDLGLKFEEMTSPREYNFTTDRIFMSIPRNTVAKLFRMSRAEEHERLRAAIKSRFTSCDGFISHYSNCIGDWLSKPLSSWDHNEIGTLLAAMVGDLNENLDLYYRVCDCDGLYNEWSEGIDWKKFETKVQQARDEKREQIDPDYVAPTPRCPLTIEMKF